MGNKTSWEAIGAALERGNGGLEIESGLEMEQIPTRFPSHKQQDLLMDYKTVWKRDKSGWPQGWGLGQVREGDISGE